jgi:hypothetical protein
LAQCTGSHESPEVLYYLAFDPSATKPFTHEPRGRVDFAISPDKLDDFVEVADRLSGVADWDATFGNDAPYAQASNKAIYLFVRGQLWDSLRSFGNAHILAVKDPSWWLSNALQAAGGLVAGVEARMLRPQAGARPLANQAGRVLTSHEMSVHVAVTWEANPVLEQLANVQQMAKTAHPTTIRPEVMKILTQFENSTGVKVVFVPEGTVQRATGGWGKNVASLNVQDGTLLIEDQVFHAQIPVGEGSLLEETMHELAAYFSGSPPNSDIPHIVSRKGFNGKIFANQILEYMMMKNGAWPTHFGIPPPVNNAKLLGFLAALQARPPYPPRTDADASAMLQAASSAGVIPRVAGGSDPFGILLDTLSASAWSGVAGMTGSLPLPKDLSQTARKVYQAMGPGTPDLPFNQIVTRSGIMGPIDVIAALHELSDAGLVQLFSNRPGDRAGPILSAWRTR